MALEATSINFSNHISLYISHNEHSIHIFSLFRILLSINNVYICNIGNWWSSIHSSSIIAVQLFRLGILYYWKFLLIAVDLYYLSLIDSKFRHLEYFYLFSLLLDDFIVIVGSKGIIITHESIISIVNNLILIDI